MELRLKGLGLVSYVWGLLSLAEWDRRWGWGVMVDGSVRTGKICLIEWSERKWSVCVTLSEWDDGESQVADMSGWMGYSVGTRMVELIAQWRIDSHLSVFLMHLTVDMWWGWGWEWEWEWGKNQAFLCLQVRLNLRVLLFVDTWWGWWEEMSESSRK